jgi:cell division protein FtsB
LRRFLTSPLACIIFIIVAILLTKSVLGLYSKAQLSVEARETSEKELGSIMERKAFVEAEISKLKTAPGMEEEIRRKFSVARPGEEVVVIIEGTKEAPVPVDESFFQSIWEKAKGIFTRE